MQLVYYSYRKVKISYRRTIVKTDFEELAEGKGFQPLLVVIATRL